MASAKVGIVEEELKDRGRNANSAVAVSILTLHPTAGHDSI